MNPNIKRLLLVGLMFALLTACTPAKTPTPIPPAIQVENPYAPQSGDGTMVRSTVRIVKTEISTLKSSPQQFSLKISFFTPTPCHQYRISVDQPGSDAVYSLMKMDKACNLMALNIPTEATLNLNSLSTGHYTVWVNGEKALEFDA